MDYFEQFGRSKGPQGFEGFGGFGRRGGGRDRFFKKGNLQFIILQMLEDRDFVSISKEGNKKIYTITDEGKTFFKENVDQDEFTKRLEQFKSADFEQMKASREQLQGLFHGFMKASQSALQDEEKQKELNVFIEETKQKLERFYK
ncbi:PadR family transcriptional regulator [Staphylococcus haemolyticus]|uniref:PadR family transcriptional regulator n=1 Tax=Staphylococcus haemolyticus TaxID=1283 RepID=UPI0018793F98|nr:PadR family transcriptional regulator [Staphylococcus haemolyticus]MBE7342835.1 PadR family transcriptional regulator [Staphylococcus haemolyticus]